MSMENDAFLSRIIDDGIAAAKVSYVHKPLHLEGAIDGFTSCRGKTASELRALLDAANKEALAARTRYGEQYWFYRCRALEIEWVCNCLSAALHNQGLPVILPPTARGYMKAASVLGVASRTS